MRIFGGGDIKEVEECCSWDNTREMANKITVFITRVQVEPILSSGGSLLLLFLSGGL